MSELIHVGREFPCDLKPTPPPAPTPAPAASGLLNDYKKHLDEARRASTVQPNVRFTSTFRDNLRDQNLELIRAHGRGIRGSEWARANLRWAATGLSPQELDGLDDLEAIRLALSNIDVADALAATADSLVATAFKAAPRNSRGWVRNSPVRSFLPHDALSIDQAGRLERHTRGGTAGHLELGLSASSWGIARYSTQTVVSDEDLLADRVGIFSVAAEQTGRAAASLVEDLIFSLILRNPTLSDNVELFHASHGNLANTALGSPGLGVAQSAIASQVLTDSDGNPALHLNLAGNTLLVPPDLGWDARELVKSGQLGDGRDVEARVENRLSSIGVVDPDAEVVIEGSNTNWLLAASHEAWPCVLLGNLGGGDPQPKIRRFTLDKGQWGIGWDCIMDIGAVVTDYRGLYWSTGTA